MASIVVAGVRTSAPVGQFPGEGRLSGLALGVTMATAIFGGFTPYPAQVLIARNDWPMVPGVMIAVVAVAVLPVLIMLPETARLRRGSS